VCVRVLVCVCVFVCVCVLRDVASVRVCARHFHTLFSTVFSATTTGYDCTRKSILDYNNSWRKVVLQVCYIRENRLPFSEGMEFGSAGVNYQDFGYGKDFTGEFEAFKQFRMRAASSVARTKTAAINANAGRELLGSLPSAMFYSQLILYDPGTCL